MKLYRRISLNSNVCPGNLYREIASIPFAGTTISPSQIATDRVQSRPPPLLRLPDLKFNATPITGPAADVGIYEFASIPFTGVPVYSPGTLLFNSVAQ